MDSSSEEEEPPPPDTRKKRTRNKNRSIEDLSEEPKKNIVRRSIDKKYRVKNKDKIFSLSRVWDENETKKLLDSVDNLNFKIEHWFSINWDFIASKVSTKRSVYCKSKFYQLRHPNADRGRKTWTSDEDTEVKEQGALNSFHNNPLVSYSKYLERSRFLRSGKNTI
jgi:hypothetical protein